MLEAEFMTWNVYISYNFANVSSIKILCSRKVEIERTEISESLKLKIKLIMYSSNKYLDFVFFLPIIIRVEFAL